MAEYFVTDDLSGAGEGAVRAGRVPGSRSWFLHSPSSCPTRPRPHQCPWGGGADTV